jgi:hypothetical protein
MCIADQLRLFVGTPLKAVFHMLLTALTEVLSGESGDDAYDCIV